MLQLRTLRLRRRRRQWAWERPLRRLSPHVRKPRLRGLKTHQHLGVAREGPRLQTRFLLLSRLRSSGGSTKKMTLTNTSRRTRRLDWRARRRSRHRPLPLPRPQPAKSDRLYVCVGIGPRFIFRQRPQASGPASSGTVAGGPESVQIVAQSQGGSLALERPGLAGPDGSVGAPSKAEACGLAWVAFGPALAPGKASGPASAPSKAESSGFEGAAGATHAAEDSVHGKGDSVQEAASTATGSGCGWLLKKGESSKLKAADYEPQPTKRRNVPPSFKIASIFAGRKER